LVSWRIRVSAVEHSEERRALRDELEALRKRWRTLRTTIHFVEPKSTRSRRTIRLPQVVISALRSHRAGQLKERLAAGGDWVDSGLVFTTAEGMPLDPRNGRRVFQAMLTAAKLPRVRFHDLRHTAATLLLSQGVDPRTIMETLGHCQISLTLNTYSLVMPALQIDAAAKIDAVLAR
jgi:integrase